MSAEGTFRPWSSDSVHDSGFEFPAVAADDEHLVAFDADGNGSAAVEFATGIAIGVGRVVFGDVLQAVHVDDDGGTAGAGKLVKNFGFGLRPIFPITAGNVSVAMVDFLGAATDGLMQVWRWSGVGFWLPLSDSPGAQW